MSADGARPPVPSAPPAGGSDVLLTRRRWARYFLPATLGAAVLAVGAALAAADPWPLAAPVAIGLLWWLLHWDTPPAGATARRLSADPEFLWLLGGLVLTVAGIVLVIEYAWPRAPALSGVLGAVYLAAMFVLMRRVDRRLKRERGTAAEPGAAADPRRQFGPDR